MRRKYFQGQGSLGHCEGSRPGMTDVGAPPWLISKVERRECARGALEMPIPQRWNTRARMGSDCRLPPWHIPRPQGGVAWRPGDIRRSTVYFLPEGEVEVPPIPQLRKNFPGG